MGINPYMTSYELWAQKTGKLLDVSDAYNRAIELGNMLEPALIGWYEKKYSKVCNRQVECRAPGDWPIVATCDAIPTDLSEVVEIKTGCLAGGNKDSLERWTDGFPEWYDIQLQTQMWCSGIPTGRLVALVGFKGILEFERELDSEYMLTVMQTCVDWYEHHIVLDIPPVAENVDVDVINRMKPNEDIEIVLTKEDEEMVDKAKDYAKQSAELKEQAEELKNQIKMRMGVAAVGKLPSGRLVKYGKRSRSAYTVQASTYRQFDLPRA